MDSVSDSSRYDLDSVTSTDSLHLLADEFRLRYSFTPDASNAELSKRVASLELANERLRIDLENSRIELNARIAANQNLKDKITELYVEAQAALQKTLKLDYELNNARSQLTAVENSKKWYQAQIHDLQASKNDLLMEIETYRQLVRQKHDAVSMLTARCKQSNSEYIELSQKLKKEKQELNTKLEELRLRISSRSATSESLNSLRAQLSPDLSTKLEATEDELRDTRRELKMIEQHLLGINVEKTVLEGALVRHKELVSTMETSIARCEMEKNETKSCLCAVQSELDKTKSEKTVLQAALLVCKQEHGQVEQAIAQLKVQLNKMITQYKLIRNRNAELESKVALLEEVKNENKTIKAQSFAANSSLFKKLRDSKKKIRSLERQLDKVRDDEQLLQGRIKTDASLQECLRRALEKNKELGERLRLASMANSLEEGIDEGYGDGCTPIIAMDVPTPKPLEPQLMQSVSQVLASGRNILNPVEMGLENLRHKLETFQYEQDTRLYDSGQMSPASPRNNVRSVV